MHEQYKASREELEELWNLNFPKGNWLGKGKMETKYDIMGAVLLSLLKNSHIALINKMIERLKVKEQKKPKGKCSINGENHMFGSCFGCIRIDRYNLALQDQITYLKEERELIVNDK